MQVETNFWNEKIETMSHDEIRAIHEKVIPERVAYAYEKSALYKKYWDEAGVRPQDIKNLNDLNQIPVIRKDLVRKRRTKEDPFGGMLLIDPKRIYRGFSTSGTSGESTFYAISETDFNTGVEVMCRNWHMIGARKGDVCLLAYAVHHQVGAMGINALQKIGCTIYPVMATFNEIDRIVNTLCYIRPKVCHFPHGFVMQVNNRLLAKGLDLRTAVSWEILQIAGEVFAKSLKDLIKRDWGAIAYGLSGLGDVPLYFLVSPCGQGDGYHIWEDLHYVEILNTETGQPCAPGEMGEIVITNLCSDAMTAIRWGTDDLGYLIDKPCQCGRNHRKLIYLGRKSYEIQINGKSVFPVQVEEILRCQPETEWPLFRLVKYSQKMEYLQVQTTYNQKLANNPPALATHLAKVISRELEVPTRVDLLSEDEIPKATYKIPVILDLT
jgi:phenylacetate-CoA ligase